MWPKREVLVFFLISLSLTACGPSERDRLADRIEPEIAATHTSDPDERREVAESLAEDVIAIRDEAQQSADADAASAKAFEAQYGTAEDAMARECEMMRHALAALQRPSTEIRTAEEIAAIPASIEDLKTRLQQNCQGR
jgi:hypothetical protein